MDKNSNRLEKRNAIQHSNQKVLIKALSLVEKKFANTNNVCQFIEEDLSIGIDEKGVLKYFEELLRDAKQSSI